MKTITLSADEGLIEAAHKKAKSERPSLDAKFRLWLSDYVGRERWSDRTSSVESERQADRVMESIRELQREISTGGRKFTREEMNERR